RRPEGDVVSVVADDNDRQFDLNTGMRMQLGSTAKLRTMEHYFEILERMQKELAPLDRDALAERIRDARDPITRWTAEQLLGDPEMSLDSLLARSLDHEYSASPGEVFFTGG